MTIPFFLSSRGSAVTELLLCCDQVLASELDDTVLKVECKGELSKEP